MQLQRHNEPGENLDLKMCQGLLWQQEILDDLALQETQTSSFQLLWCSDMSLRLLSGIAKENRLIRALKVKFPIQSSELVRTLDGV